MGYSSKSNSISADWVIAAAVGGVAVFGAAFFLPTSTITNIVVGIPSGIATFTGIYLLRPVPNFVERIALDVSTQKLEASIAIDKGKAKLRAIRDAAMDIHAPNVRRRITGIANVGDEIISNLTEDTDNIRAANLWLNNYLDMFLGVVKQYGKLSRQGLESADAQASMAKMDETLDTISNSFDELLKKLVNNDIFNFDIDSKVLVTMLDSEGV